jgi:hypothetical protein
MPPRDSTERMISRIERPSVPLNTRCSMKWAMPLSSRFSWRDPAPTFKAMPTEPDPTTCSLTKRSPFSNTRISTSTGLISSGRISDARRGATGFNGRKRARPGCLTVRRTLRTAFFRVERTGKENKGNWEYKYTGAMASEPCPIVVLLLY